MAGVKKKWRWKFFSNGKRKNRISQLFYSYIYSKQSKIEKKEIGKELAEFLSTLSNPIGVKALVQSSQEVLSTDAQEKVSAFSLEYTSSKDVYICFEEYVQTQFLSNLGNYVLANVKRMDRKYEQLVQLLLFVLLSREKGASFSKQIHYFARFYPHLLPSAKEAVNSVAKEEAKKALLRNPHSEFAKILPRKIVIEKVRRYQLARSCYLSKTLFCYYIELYPEKFCIDIELLKNYPLALPSIQAVEKECKEQGCSI